MRGATRQGGLARAGRWWLPPLALLATACQGPPIGGRSPVEASVAAYYAAHASEEGGVCLQPYMDGITAVRPVEETAEGRTVRVRYFYRDRFKTARENAGTCIGFDERTFALAAEGPGGGWQVVDMSGPRRS